MAQWPEPPPTESDIAQRWTLGALVVVAAAVAIVVMRADEGQRSFNFAMPNIGLPELSLPEISLPNVSMPDIDLRGRETQSADTPPVTASIAESMGEVPFDPNAPVQNVPFETCIGMLAEFPDSMGPPILAEDTPDRRVQRYKLLTGNLTLTCSRADNTLTIEQH